MGRPALEAVKRHLRDKQLLLVADNFEQVEAAPMLEELLCGPGAEGDGHASRVSASGRAGVSGSVAGHAQPRTPPGCPRLGPVRGSAAVHRAGPCGAAKVSADRGERPSRSGDHLPPRWPAAGHRVGRHPHQGPNAPGDAAAAPAAPLHPHRRCPYPPGAPTDPPRRHRLELRPARGGRTAAVRPTVSVRRGLDARVSGGGVRPGRPRP